MTIMTYLVLVADLSDSLERTQIATHLCLMMDRLASFRAGSDSNRKAKENLLDELYTSQTSSSTRQTPSPARSYVDMISDKLSARRMISEVSNDGREASMFGS